MRQTVNGRRWCGAVLMAGASFTALAEGTEAPQFNFASNYDFRYGSYQLVYTTPVKRDDRLTLLGIDSQVSIARLTNLDLFNSPLHDIKFATQTDARDDWHSLRYGLRVDMDLPSSGRFYLNIGASRDSLNDRQSYRLAMPVIGTDGAQRPWAVGVFVESSSSGFSTRLGLAPQLSFRLDHFMKTRTPIDIIVQYSSWSGAPDGARAIQATFSSSF